MRLSTLALATFACLLNVAGAAARPNIVLIIADDMGWGDVGYNGSEIQTPNLDRLAESGVRLDRFYATPACSSTRASLMTGQSTARTGVKRAIFQTSDASLPLELRILPEFLRDAGYRTALVGKWHLGHARREMLPLARGFDYAYGYLTGGIGHYDHVGGGRRDWHRNEVTLREEGYATHLIADDAIRQIEDRDTDRPLFLYVAFSAPHLPNEAPAETVSRYADIEDGNRRVYAAMVDEMDQAIGAILAALEEAGMTDDTLVWFMSDNGGTHRKYSRDRLSAVANMLEDDIGGPARTRLLEFIRSSTQDGGADNGPYQGGKGTLGEGGVLVPSVVSFPGHFPPRPLSQRITVQDILPTLTVIAGAETEPEQPVDGADQTALLRGLAHTAPVDYLVEDPSGAAYYMDNWKLRRSNDDALALFDLDADPYENRDLANDHPEIVATMHEKLAAFPRREPVHAPMRRFFLDPDVHGGSEEDQPWTDIVR
ncbi:MAG: sulfatase-like hydrolase/transferase [Gammaproteobacteria bacterium]|nr:sulfatase-like hydrolase/transferase [Gammaproteobacteria bacterium]